jgi:replicative DNA helicase
MSIEERINDGLSGKYKGLNNGFDRLNKLLFGIQRGTYYLIGGQSGTFKTTLTDYMVINAMEDAKKLGVPLNVYYYSFEIDKLTKQCNWLSVLVYQKYNIVVPPEKIKGLGDNRLTKIRTNKQAGKFEKFRQDRNALPCKLKRVRQDQN